MIVVNIQLDSAISPTRDKELARMEIFNTGPGSKPGTWNYGVRTLRGRNKDALDKHVVNRVGTLTDIPSDDHHVWYLIAEALKAVEYQQRPKK